MWQFELLENDEFPSMKDISVRQIPNIVLHPEISGRKRLAIVILDWFIDLKKSVCTLRLSTRLLLYFTLSFGVQLQSFLPTVVSSTGFLNSRKRTSTTKWDIVKYILRLVSTMEDVVDSTGSALLDTLVHYGLFIGAIFQLICILAVIFLPPTNEGSTVEEEVQESRSPAEPQQAQHQPSSKRKHEKKKRR